MVAASSSLGRTRFLTALAMAAGLLGALLAGCGQREAAVAPTAQSTRSPPTAAISATPLPQVDAVRIVSLSKQPPTPYPVLNKTVTGAAQVRRLLAALLALPVFPSYTILCPLDDTGYLYQVMFYSGNAEVLEAKIDPSGCRDVRLQSVDHRWAATDPNFWRVFAATFGVPGSPFSDA